MTNHPAANGDEALLTRVLGSEPLRIAAAIVLDVVVVVASYVAALLLRFDVDVPHTNAVFAAEVVLPIALGFVLANYIFGVYRTMWAYGSLGDILALFRPVFLMTALLFAINFWLSERDLPLSVILIAGALIFPGMAVVKMRTRLLVRMPWAAAASRRLLIVGAGHTGQLLARELQNAPNLNYQPVGFLDDNPRKLHSRVHGLRVLGPVDHLEAAIRSQDVEVVAIAIPGAPGALMREIVGVCQRLDVPVRMVPGVEKWVLGSHSDALRDITLDDLLGREPVEIDFAACSESVRDRIVLVTGAAGSIGSELCRQLLAFRPLEIHLIDNNESGLYELSFELSRISAETAIRLWVANVVDAARIDSIFRRARPDLVYHAAALKHVPLMEEHPGEAFRVNVLGSLNVMRASRTYQASRFVLISTDKAVRPSSIMGATKRVAELLVLAFSRQSELTDYAAVRFGNVMGSRGSVVPLFMSQIERGGPVTVMHPDMMRYFISIPEAVSLVIQAGTFGGKGTISMLDMGDEINIRELAERIIRLRGLRPGEDIEVVFTGPRPGEKLREELVADYETVLPTEHAKVRRIVSPSPPTEEELVRMIGDITQSMWDDDDALRQRIHLVVRRYSRASSPDPQDGAEQDAGKPAST